MRNQKLLGGLCVAVCLNWSLCFAGGNAAGKPARADELTVLRQQVAKQQQQIEELHKTLEDQKRLLLQIAGERSSAVAKPSGSSLNTTSSEVPKAHLAVAKSAEPSAMRSPGTESAAPLSFRIGKADFTPGGFMDFTGVYRTTNVGSGIGTSFGSIPFANTTAGNVGETRFSAQNSRVTLKVEAQPNAGTDVTGYLEADFLGSHPSNGFVTSNSNTLRMRLYWVDLVHSKWEILGGQSWSLLTPGRSGISPVPSNIFYGQDMDTNYQAGLVWSRDAQFRVVYHANRHFSAGLSLENPEQYTGSTVVFPSSYYNGQTDNGSNPATANQRPDIIGKVALDGHIGGRSAHLEFAGLLRGFSVRRPDGSTSSINGGGGSVNANLEIFKHFNLIANTYFSDGGGRYIMGLGPDVIIRPDGSLSAVHADSTIGGFEYSVTPGNLIYGYYGGAYFQKNYSLNGGGEYVGFGFPGSSLGSNRTIQEATLGYIRTFWKNPNYGALKMISQYSYLTRSPWWVPANSPKNARTNMVYLDLRYELP